MQLLSTVVRQECALVHTAPSSVLGNGRAPVPTLRNSGLAHFLKGTRGLLGERASLLSPVNQILRIKPIDSKGKRWKKEGYLKERKS